MPIRNPPTKMRPCFNNIPMIGDLGKIGEGEGGQIVLPPSCVRSIYDIGSGAYLYQKPLDYICIVDLQCNCE